MKQDITSHDKPKHKLIPTDIHTNVTFKKQVKNFKTNVHQHHYYIYVKRKFCSCFPTLHLYLLEQSPS